MPQNAQLIKELGQLLQTHRASMGQDRISARSGASTQRNYDLHAAYEIRQAPVAIGLGTDPWSAWYRVFSRGRFDEEGVTEQLFRETLQHVCPDEVPVVGDHGMPIARGGLQSEGGR